MKIFCLLVIGALLSFSCTKEQTQFIDETIHISHEGAEMPAYIKGNAANQTFIVMLHGVGSFGLAYQNGAFTSVLEEQYVMVYFDQRAQSMSEGHFTNSDNLIKLMSEDVEALTSVLQHRYGQDIKLFIMGHSWGGLLSANTLLETNAKNSYRGWINIAGALDLENVTTYRKILIKEIADEQIQILESTSEWMSIKDKADELTDYDEVLQLSAQVIHLLQKDGAIENSLTIEKLKSAIVDNNPITWQVSNFFNRPVEQVLENEYSLVNRMNEIDLPTLFIYGKYDVSVPPEVGRTAFSKIGTEQKEYKLYSNSIHHPFDTEPSKFGEDVVAFIEKYR